MPCPSPLHDPLAKLVFPDAPLAPQLRHAAERERRDSPDNNWADLLDAAADRLLCRDTTLAGLKSEHLNGLAFSPSDVLVVKVPATEITNGQREEIKAAIADAWRGPPEVMPTVLVITKGWEIGLVRDYEARRIDGEAREA